MEGRVEVGSKAPDFTLVSHLGDKVTLSNELKTKKAVVLAFYVLDFTGTEQRG